MLGIESGFVSDMNFDDMITSKLVNSHDGVDAYLIMSASYGRVHCILGQVFEVERVWPIL